MKKLKVATILGTRPEIIRLVECIKLCDKYFEHILIHTGQNYDYELNEIFFEDLELRKPDFFLNVAGNHLGETIGNVISKSYEILASEKPDA
jgi:UDP-N-acetylglucosamine 2-epimerase (non-hydrolysing)